tara:strand:- start:2320 stop:2991 length:672 start_codon:yes stop_codon:yes gene_type:complete
MNIILQHFDGDLRPLDEKSVENIMAYADMVGAEYRLIRGKPFRKHLTSPCQKVYMLDKEFDEYDQVLMLDIDMFAPIGMEENIFELEGVGLYADVQKMLHRKIAAQYPMIANLSVPYWGGAIYKMDKTMRTKLRTHLGSNEGWMNNYNKLYHFEDEGIMHTLAYQQGLKCEDKYILEQKWCQCSFLPNPENAGFIHVRTKITPTGPKREKIENYNELVSKGVL